MTEVSEKPAWQEYQGTCETHGDFTSLRCQMLSDTHWMHRGCPECNEIRGKEYAEREAREDERRRLEQAERDKVRLRRAGVPLRFESKTLDTYRIANDKQQIAVAACRRLIAAVQDGKAAPNLILIGKPGTGKSHLCCGVVLELYRTHKVARIDLPDLIREIRATWQRDSDYTEEQVLDYYGGLDLLILEEIGTGAGSDDERARVFQVINRRYEAMLPTVVVSNLDMESLKREIGERVIDRLREGDRSLVVFDWASARGDV
jgi:DNA replication protein DnaC